MGEVARMLENLKALRIEMGISQSKLGEEIGVTQQAVNKYENHNIEPGIYTLKLLADFFDTSIDYLVGYSDERNPRSGGEAMSISAREENLIKAFRKLNRKQRESIEYVIANYLEK